MTEYKCDHCGKVEDFNVLCADCEDLACEECGQVVCACEPEDKPVVLNDEQRANAVFHASRNLLTALCLHRRIEVMAMLLTHFENENSGFIISAGEEINKSIEAAMKAIQQDN